MKKIAVALLASMAIMSVGCSNKNNDTTNNSQEPVDYITEQKVNDIVLADTPKGNIVEFTFDKDDLRPNYDVTVADGKNTYEYEIDAVTGDIISKQIKNENTANNTDTTNLIDAEKAKAIALEIVPNGTIVEVDFDKEDVVPNYDVKVTDGEYEYEYEINAKDGSIITESKELLNN